MDWKWLSPSALLLVICSVSISRADDEQHDAREGDDVTMQCRFSPELANGDPLTYYWVRSTASGHDNVAIGDIPLETNYQVMYKPMDGRFDLMVANVSYERDNGRFECRIKAGGTGRNLHAQGHALTVLTQPRAPLLAPGMHAQAYEGRELNLTCSSSGGSPEPVIKWYRDGSTYPMDAQMIHAKVRTEATTAVLAVSPTRDDDGAIYRCVVWNRAMSEGEQLDATVELNVSYFPRVDVGPENPLRVEMDGTATMDCKVDAKPKVNSVRWTRNGKFISNSFTHTIQKVTVQDAGKYTCTADNGLGRPGERDMYLDVLFPPSVSVESKTFEAEEGGNVEIKCEVSANPEPTSIEWTMEGKPDFYQNGNMLKLTRVNADMAGTYLCKATNVISSSNGNRVERASSASVAVLVRHKPGRAHIRPDRPVAQDGTGVTLTCSAQPPGWPAPQYRWFRETDPVETKPAVLATGSTYTIPKAHLGSEGIYHCQATNELGHGELASVALEVHQPPRFQTKLQTHATQRAGELGYSATCSALGKPQPSVKWYKNNSEIKPDANLYEVQSEVTEGRSAVYTVQSTLKFKGKARPHTNDLLPEDRGVYSCIIENEVKKIESTMHLKIEHEPISIKHHDKVAYDLMEVADIVCRVQAYPRPEFQWFYGSNTASLQMSSDGHYEINTTDDNNDSYLSILRIKNVRVQDYGDYYCKVKNTLGDIRPQIRLQPKGAPESPRVLESQKVGASFVTLKWEAGFDGGLSSTKYFVRYRRVVLRGAAAGAHCVTDRAAENEWLEYDCGRTNPCNVTRLDQHNTYTFKVKAVNTKGQSNYSNEITVTTKVDRIAPAERVTFDPKTNAVTFTAPPTCLALVAVAEGLAVVGGTTGWQVVDTMPLKMSGESTVVETVIELPSQAGRRPGAQHRHAAEPPDDLHNRVRIKLCLQLNQDVCTEYTEAEIGPAYVKEAYIVTMTSLIVSVMVTLVVVLMCLALFVVLRRRSNRNNKNGSKDFEMGSMKPSPIVTPQNKDQPPPYEHTAGMENKALEHSMDMGLGIDDSKNPMYSQGGYSYHVPRQAPHPGQPMPHNDWNMGFVDSYTNSNHGGSVNSQESLWQKAAGGAGEGMPQLDRQSNYEYDAMAHGGYRGDEFAQYSRLPHSPHPPHPPHPPPAEYGMRSQNPSRQEYCSDPYASVHKPKKPRRDQHIESPYHEVSGLPEYRGAGAEGEDKPPAHLSLSYDESLESGYSTPNTRAQRVIREIIV